MTRLALIVGALLITFGVIWRSFVYINDWNCAHSLSVMSCISDTLPTFSSYALIALGLVLVGASFLNRGASSDVPTMDSQKKSERVP
jgi:hypothetical protein